MSALPVPVRACSTRDNRFTLRQPRRRAVLRPVAVAARPDAAGGSGAARQPDVPADRPGAPRRGDGRRPRPDAGKPAPAQARHRRAGHAAAGGAGRGAAGACRTPRPPARSTGSSNFRSAARSVTGMAAILAHEVKNPLSGIRGAAQLLESSVADADRELTVLIRDEADRIRALVDRMEMFGEKPIERGGGEHPPRAGACPPAGAERLRRRISASPRSTTRRCRRCWATATSWCRCCSTW